MESFNSHPANQVHPIRLYHSSVGTQPRLRKLFSRAQFLLKTYVGDQFDEVRLKHAPRPKTIDRRQQPAARETLEALETRRPATRNHGP